VAKASPTLAAALAALPPALRPAVETAIVQLGPLPAGVEPALGATLPRVFAASEFAARTCARHPEWLAALARDFASAQWPAPGSLARAAVADCADEAGFMARLRQVRQQVWLGLAWRDLSGAAQLQDTAAAACEFADTAIDLALAQAARGLASRHGTPRDARGAPAAMCVFALGKLGGEDLNFSSDVDLIFAYSAEGETDGAQPLSNHEYFTRLGRRLIALLSEPTADGFVFRVDMRLRPNGASGPLALGFDATEEYYQTHGREWERYALIKARAVAGDRAAGAVLLERLRPFVYRRYLDYGAVQAIREMKELIARELRRKGVQDNIKLGAGGIREVEFIGQTYQLIRGGRAPDLQSHRLLPVLDYLGSSGMLPAADAAQLRDDYVFLRTLENRLQMLADQQTQVLPADPLVRARVAFATGVPDWDALAAEVARRMQRVHEHFTRLFAAAGETSAHGASQPLVDVWSQTIDEPRAALARAGFADPGAVLSVLAGLRGGAAFRAMSANARARLDRLVPLVLEQAAVAPGPDATVARVVHVIEAIGRRTAYFALLIENPAALEQLVRLCSASSWIAGWISNHPILLDELLNPSVLYTPWSREELASELAARLARIPEEDLEAQMDALREFRHGHVLRVAAADITGALGPEEVSASLCDVAETVLEQVLAVARAGLAASLGTPRDADGRETGFIVVAYGKLGSRELGYTSDLDLVFLYDERDPAGHTDGPREVANEVYFGRLGQRIVHVLTTHTQAGRLFEIDMRLRPSGRAGLLVTTLGSWRRYQDEHAWTWEHQALVRARPVAGDPDLAADFLAVRREVLARVREPARLAEEVRAMRARMIQAHGGPGGDVVHLKQDRGGIVDVEFIVQYCVLRWAAEHPELTEFTDNIRLLGVLARTHCLTERVARQLIGAYRRFLATEHRAKLLEQPPLISADELVQDRDNVIAAWRELLGEAPGAGGPPAAA